MALESWQLPAHACSRPGWVKEGVMHHHSIAVWIAIFAGVAVAMGGAIVAAIIADTQDKQSTDA
jgi:hypothetical protein